MRKLKEIIHEAHRRSLWQVLGIYIAASWVVLQVIEVLGETAGLPTWVGPGAIVVLLVGLPIVLATAFVQEGVGGRARDEVGGRAATEDPLPVGGSGTPTPVGGSETPTPVGGVSAETPERGAASPSRAPARAPAGPAGSETPVPAAPASSGGHRFLTWRNAVLAGAGAFLLLGLVTGGYLAMRTLGIGPAGTLVAKGVLEERDRILLADFEGRGGSDLLAETVTEALRVDLARSQVVRLAEPSAVADGLRRMERPADARLDPPLARELAQREGIKAVLAGDVSPAGTGYVLAARLLSPASGEILTSERVTAADSAQILPAIDDLSKRLRERMGESLRTIRREEPLPRVTTGDLEALRKYTLALEAIEVDGDFERGVSLLEEAVARDSTFAMAYRKLGQELMNRGEDRGRALEALTRAYEERDRLAERERYLAEAAYYQRVMDDMEATIRAYENILALDPADPWALNNLGVMYSEMGEFARAEEYFERATAADSVGVLSFTNTVNMEVAQGKWDEAAATLEVVAARYPDNFLVQERQVFLPAAQRDWEAAQAKLEEIRAEWRPTLFLRERGAGLAGALAAVRGRLEEAEADVAEAEETALERDRPAGAFGWRVRRAWLDQYVREDDGAARAELDAAVERYPPDELPLAERSYPFLASLYAGVGDAATARRYLEAHEREIPAELRMDDEDAVRGVRSEIAAAEGRWDEAIALQREIDRDACPLCDHAILADLFHRAGRPDSAMARMEAFVGTPQIFGLYWDATMLGLFYERLARGYDERGDTEKARLYYAKLTELWAEADEELQPRVEAARSRLEELLEAGG